MTNLQVINGYPWIRWETLQHRYEKLQTSRPMSNQEHHANQIEDPHEYARHVKKLQQCITSINTYRLNTSVSFKIHSNQTKIFAYAEIKTNVCR